MKVRKKYSRFGFRIHGWKVGQQTKYTPEFQPVTAGFTVWLCVTLTWSQWHHLNIFGSEHVIISSKHRCSCSFCEYYIHLSGIDNILNSGWSHRDFSCWFLDCHFEVSGNDHCYHHLVFLEPEGTIFGWERGAMEDVHWLYFSDPKGDTWFLVIKQTIGPS